MNRLNGLKLYLTCLILRRDKKKKYITPIQSIFVKSKICCQDSKENFPSYIVDTAFLTLTIIKSCDLYTDL